MFLENIVDNFLTQMIQESKRMGALLHLIITNKEGLVGGVKVKSSLGCDDREIVEFGILRRRIGAKCKITALNFRKADFGLFKDLLVKSYGMDGRVTQGSWLIFKDHLLQAQE